MTDTWIPVDINLNFVKHSVWHMDYTNVWWTAWFCLPIYRNTLGKWQGLSEKYFNSMHCWIYMLWRIVGWLQRIKEVMPSFEEKIPFWLPTITAFSALHDHALAKEPYSKVVNLSHFISYIGIFLSHRCCWWQKELHKLVLGLLSSHIERL